MKNKSESRTLLMSVLMSAPGPIVVGLGLLVGRSSTQLADFFRRSAELLAIIAAFVVYRLTNKDGDVDEAKKARLERAANLFIAAMMCLSGAIMFILAARGGNEDKGNVIPGLVIALLGVIANTIFWFRYAKLSRRGGNAILAVQSSLYRAKAFVDMCVTVVLLTVAVFPQAKMIHWIDIVGSLTVALYMIWSGIKTVRQ